MIARALASIAILTCASARIALAQDGAGERLAISVLVVPQVAYPGSSVRISGKTLAIGANATVHIAFLVDNRADHNDKAKNISATATVDGNGLYSAMARIDQPGVYRVRATAPDGKGIDSTTYILLDPPNLTDEVVSDFDKLVTEGMQPLVHRIRAQVLALPPNPAKIDAEAKLSAIEQKIMGWPEQSKKLHSGIERFQSLPSKYPAAAPLFQPRLEKIAEIAGEMPAEKARVDAELARSQSAGVTCEKIEQLIQSLKVVSAAANFLQSKVADVGLAFGIDLGAEGFAKAFTPASLKGNSEYATVLTEGSKFLANIVASSAAFPVALGVLVTDAVVYVQQKNFEKYCEKIEGPFSATMHAEFFQEKAPWWKYDMTLKGTLTLRYAKTDAPGSAAHVTGELVGSAAKLGVWEDALAVLYPVTQKTSTLLRKMIVPPGMPYSETEGKMAAASSPFGFFIPVEGDLVGDKLTLHMLEARSDLSDAIDAQVTYVLIGPMILAPIIVRYQLPFVKARFLLNRAMSESPIVLSVEVGRNAMRVSRSLKRTRPGAGNTADYTLDIKACNPGCE
ncbi:MAG: hypothetical protein M3081_09415 [Gemmatimonadota bacterium]|nr:hypothetical protein [Gemmatimonadota bacterium]